MDNYGNPLNKKPGRIKIVSDDAGDDTRIELDWNGTTIFIDVTDALIRVSGSKLIQIKEFANAVEILP